MKKRRLLFTLPIFAITLIAIFTLFLAPTDAAFGPFNPLPPKIVPDCNITLRSGDQITGLGTICTFCDFLTLTQNILNYTWWLITPIVIVIALIWGGALMFISSTQGNVTLAQKGKKIIFNTLIGFVLVFGAWLIIDTVIKILGGKMAVSVGGVRDGFGPWNKITCVAPVVSTTLPPPGEPQPPPASVGTEQALAKALFEAGLCGGTASCGSVNACTTLRNVSQGFPPPVCFSGCTSSSVCPTNPDTHLSIPMLQTLDTLYKENLKFGITSLTTGSHSTNSKHYQGKAVDLVARQPTTYVLLASALRNRGATLVQCEKNGVAVSCAGDAIDHVHAEFP
ncbi:MAG: hypothetical protein UX94_C0007G0006 [Parcubacteria group bacterium GW2011_GWA2_47_21]|nr:MAG: hypothetical protein UX94_C0007G0006 [Parcubacteria group bacterium GW2011_GWA2_47_21]